MLKIDEPIAYLSSEVRRTEGDLPIACADADIVAEVRSWLGTRWVHGQAVKGHGTDCVGFIIQLGKTFNWIPQAYKPPIYSCQHALHRDTSLLLEEIAKFAVPIAHSLSPLACEVGDILVFRYEGTAGHAGIYIGNDRFVHAYMPKRKVMEASLKDFRRYLNSVWRPMKQLIADSSKENQEKQLLRALSLELSARTSGAPCK